MVSGVTPHSLLDQEINADFSADVAARWPHTAWYWWFSFFSSFHHLDRVEDASIPTIPPSQNIQQRKNKLSP
jgi:hypothetical protein